MKSDLTLERMSTGELHLDLTADEKGRLQALEADNQAFLRRHPQLPTPPRKTPWFLVVPGSLAAALALVVGLGTLLSPQAEETRMKSADLALFVYHKTATGTELLSPSTPLGQSDEIQLAYFSAKKQYAAILSLDGRGSITIHLPLHSAHALEVDTAKPVLLPYSYRLDDAPDFETLYLVTSSHGFDVDQVKPFLNVLVKDHRPNLLLPSDFMYTAFRITKKETSR